MKGRANSNDFTSFPSGHETITLSSKASHSPPLLTTASYVPTAFAAALEFAVAGDSPTRRRAPRATNAFTTAPTTTGCVQTAASGFFGDNIFGLMRTVFPSTSGGGQRRIISWTAAYTLSNSYAEHFSIATVALKSMYISRKSSLLYQVLTNLSLESNDYKCKFSLNSL